MASTQTIINESPFMITTLNKAHSINRFRLLKSQKPASNTYPIDEYMNNNKKCMYLNDYPIDSWF